MSFRLKAVLAIALIEVLVLASLLWLHGWSLHSTNAQRFAEQAQDSAQLLATSVADAVVTLDLATVDSILAAAIDAPNVAAARVISPTGVVLSESGDAAGAWGPEAGLEAAFGRAPVTVGGTDFGAVKVALSTAALRAEVTAALRHSAGIAALQVLVVALVGWLIGASMLRQLEDLRAGAARVGAGEEGVRVPVRSGDELGRTAEAFNLMTARLADARRLLASRTEELAAEKARAEAALAAEQARKLEQIHARQVETAKAGFIATISHELRTPLNGVIGATDLLLADPDATPRQRQSLRIVAESGARLLAQLNDLLYLAAADIDADPGGEAASAPFALAPALRQVAARRAPAAAGKGVSLTLTPPPDLRLMGDAARFTRALDSLVHNAVKFTAVGGVTVAAEACEVEGRLRVTVHDSGPGVPDDQHARIFEKFAQARPEDHARHGGAGLGLPVARALARSMGGDVTLLSGAPGATAFALDIPLRPAPASVPPAPAPPAAAADRQALRVLLVDDNAVNLSVLGMLLEKAGVHDRTTADDGAAAVACATERRFDIVFMDCQMPTMDGFEATRRIRALEQGSPGRAAAIVALTASAQSGDRERCHAAGMDDFLAKPVTLSAVEAALDRWACVPLKAHRRGASAVSGR